LDSAAINPMARKREELSLTEQEVLKTLWELGAGTVRDVCQALNRDGRRRVYTTVLTFLARLESKGYVASDKKDVAHVFRPIVSREALLSQRITRLVDEVCEGTATPVVQALVRGKHLSSDDIAQLRRLLDDLEQQVDRGLPETRRKRKK
jgi:predicted transcriptional regulator